MLSEKLRNRLSQLHGQTAAAEDVASPALASAPAELPACFPEGSVRETAKGSIFAAEVSLKDIYADGERLGEDYLGAFRRAGQLAEEESLPAYLAPIVDVHPGAAAFIDTETAGFHGRPLFLIGLAQFREEEVFLTQYFARDYAEEAGVLAELAELLPRLELLISFNGKAFDWPFVRDRMIYHRVACETRFAHLDLLHPSRRRWRARLPNCKLQTLERYLCGRWRRGDIPGEEIPQRYHDFVRAGDARLIAPVFHHNRLDVITMIELLIALVSPAPS
jgi:uncharacterized protein YprB with RNaseH-like and TPR domain